VIIYIIFSTMLHFQSEKLMRQVSETWEEKLQRSEQTTQERQAALEKMGISVQQSGISVSISINSNCIESKKMVCIVIKFLGGEK